MSLLRWAFIASLACGATATAQAPRPIVALTFIGNEADRAAFTGSLSELLMRIDIDMGARQTDGPLPKDRLLAIVTADWSAPNDVTVNILDAQQKVVLVRRLSRVGHPSVVIEAATHIVQSVIEELAHPTVRLSAPPTVAANVAPLAPAKVVEVKAPPPPASATGLALEIAGFIGGRGYGLAGSGQPPGGPWGRPAPIFSPSGGLRLAVTLAGGRWRPTAWVLGEYQAPFEISGLLFDLNIQVVPLRAGLGATALGGSTWRLDVGLGAGADIFSTNPRSGQLASDRLVSSVQASPILTGVVALHVAVARSADVWLAFTLDGDLAPRRWVATAGTARQTVFTPWPARPSLQLGFSFGAVGPEPYAARLGGAQ